VIKDKELQRVSFIPGWINELAAPRLLTRREAEFQEVVDYMDRWCKELGTDLSVQGDEVVVCPQQGSIA